MSDYIELYAGNYSIFFCMLNILLDMVFLLISKQ